LTVSMVFYPSN